jgi:hypothetical protein
MEQAGRSRVRFPMRSLDFSVDLVEYSNPRNDIFTSIVGIQLCIITAVNTINSKQINQYFYINICLLFRI